MQRTLFATRLWPLRRPRHPAVPPAAARWRLPRRRLATIPLGRMAPQGTVLAAVAVLLTLLGAERAWGLGLGVGAAAGALACGWAARRWRDERPVWIILGGACFSLAIGQLARVLAQTGPTPPAALRGVEPGDLLFGVAAAAAPLAWPEVRRASGRILGTLLDTATLVLAIALWGTSGFPPLGSFLPGPAVAGLAHTGILALPAITALLVAPQLTSNHRRTGWTLGAAALGVFLGGLLGSREFGQLGAWAALAGPTWALALGLLVTAAAFPRPDTSGVQTLAEDVTQPPMSVVGLAGLAGLACAVVAPTAAPGGLILALTLGLGAREALHVVTRRRAEQQLEASLDLERRLLVRQTNLGPGIDPATALRASCQLAIEVLHAEAALAWVAESDALVLTAVAPERREFLLGRRLLQSDAESLAPRVYRAGRAELCEVRAPEARVDRFLSTVLDAGMLLGVPIMREGTPIGTLVLVRERGRPAFSHFDLERALLIVAQAESALRRLELYEEVAQQLRETTLLHRFAVQAVSARNINDVGWYLLESMRSRVPFQRGTVYLSEGGARASLTPIAHFRPSGVERALAGSDEASQLRVALQYGDSTLGYVDLYRSAADPFAPSETVVAERLAQQAAVAIQNVRLQEVSGKVSTYRELDRLKTEMLSTVSHDLRGPLTNIKGYASMLAEVLADAPLDEEQREDLRLIEEEADRLRDLLDHLLDLTKIEAGVLSLDLQPLHLARLVDQTLAGMTSRLHTFEPRVPDELFVMADRRRLRQVLENLLGNAAKYSPQGGPIRVVAECVDGSEVVVSVVDRGVGIPRHQWDRVFRPYQRADTAKSHGIPGTGLGLAICKGIVEAHGGRIWVESEPGQGTVFSFSIPRGFTASTDTG